jgi:lipopolysaccharide/colanic/teichoic acid biosynthesis glycosyltransferase
LSNLFASPTKARDGRLGYSAAKRASDFVLAAVILVLAMPLLVLIGTGVRLTSHGPATFRQKRVGMHGRTFEILKFRTMTTVQGGGPSITVAGDERVTRLGQILRRYKLDELPQLINILRGDMSFVGPRPEIPKYVALFLSDFEEILLVRPGLTDYAAIQFSNEEEVLASSADPERTYVEEVLPQKIALYRRYLATRSLWVDLALMVRTCWSVAMPRR